MGIQRNTLNNQTFVLYPEVALRYFFFEDYLKPYAGVQLSYVHAFLDTDANDLTFSEAADSPPSRHARRTPDACLYPDSSSAR